MGTPTILVVDDDLWVRHFLLEALRREGFSVLVAASGPEALQISDAVPAPPNLLITDIDMPGMSGFELANEFAKNCPGAPILFLSGRSDWSELGDALTAKRCAFLGKPFKLPVLRRTVLDLMEFNVRRAGS